MNGTYAGPARWDLSELIGRQVAEHRRQLMFARACRMTGNRGGRQRALERAKLARLTVVHFMACARAA